MKDIQQQFINSWLKASEEQQTTFRGWLDEIHVKVDEPSQHYEKQIKAGSNDLILLGKKMLADALLLAEQEMTLITEGANQAEERT